MQWRRHQRHLLLLTTCIFIGIPIQRWRDKRLRSERENQAQCMDTNPSKIDLHLPELSITGFRGIANLSIPRLGRVTLIAGKNGVGKTTLLDAVRIYAARGYPALTNVLQSREELTASSDEDGDTKSVPDFEALFHGRNPSSDSFISIGPDNHTKRLTIRVSPNLQQKPSFSEDFSAGDEPLFEIECQDKTQVISMRSFLHSSRFRNRGLRLTESELPPPIRCESSGPSIINNASMARLWDHVALTDYETQAVQALRLIYGNEIDRVAMVGDEERPQAFYRRRALVKLESQERPVPLKSLGDGATRLFSIALALANSQDGFLLIDEAENGIHHSVQPDFWKMVMKTAHENNVQVLATTHGWDCVAGFAQAARDSEEVDGVLIRLERNDAGIRVVEYSEEELQVAAKQGIEVR